MMREIADTSAPCDHFAQCVKASILSAAGTATQCPSFAWVIGRHGPYGSPLAPEADVERLSS
jgi:hypothetical protein